MSTRFRTRSPFFYRVAIGLPLVALGFLVATGRMAEYFRAFRTPRALPEDAFFYHFTTAGVWVVSLAPLLFAAWELGNQHTSARRLGYQLFVGIREVFRIARAGTTPGTAPESFSVTPRDRPGIALLLGLGTFLLVPLFFAIYVPDLRSTRGLVWLTGAGALMGLAVYGHRRAVPYLTEDARGWGIFQQWRMLSPARYSGPGRPFAWIRLAATVTFPIWWLGGGVFIISPP